MMIVDVFAAAGNAEQVVIIEILLADGAAELAPLRPFYLDRRDRQEERAREVALRADAGVTISAIRSDSRVEEKGSTVTKSTVPAIVVFRPSIGNRVMVRMPDSPATSLVQLSVLPAPSEVTMPMPVTTTVGRPNLSCGAVMFPPLVTSMPKNRSTPSS
jgi:hypothetical protein